MRELLNVTLTETTHTVLVDMEASIEHMRRATIRHVDTLLVITEPYYRALEAAGRLIRLARQLKIQKILGVANKVRTDREEAAIRTYMKGLDVPMAAVIPFDEAVGEADLDGKALLDRPLKAGKKDRVPVRLIATVAGQTLDIYCTLLDVREEGFLVDAPR